MNFYSWVEQSPKVSWVSLGRGSVRSRAIRAYSITSYLKQRACVCNSRLTKPSGSDKGIQWSPVAKAHPLPLLGLGSLPCLL